GRSAPRFLLSLDVPTPAPYMGQIVIMTPGIAERDSLKAALAEFAKTQAGVEIFAKYIELGPPVGKPVQYRVTGPDRAVLLEQARQIAGVLHGDARLNAITIDEAEPLRVV